MTYQKFARGVLVLLLLSLSACSAADDDPIPNPGGDPSPADPTECADTEAWDPAWTKLEDDILKLVNEVRDEGADCGGESFARTHPLVMDPALRCAARLHSKDMAENDFFAHENLEGEAPWPRIEDAGFTGNGSGENIAAGSNTAQGTMDQWMNSEGHCANIMSDANFIGVGYYPGGDFGHMWTQTFGR
jgi:uncharacterized protein YkwD